MQSFTLAELFAHALEYRPVPKHWLKELVPDFADDDGTIAAMRNEAGLRPPWIAMPPQDRRAELRAQLPAILAGIERAQSDELHLRDLLPEQGFEKNKWRQVGLTRVGGMLEVWYGIADFFTIPGGHWRFEYDIVIVRAPITNDVVRGAVLDREEWRAAWLARKKPSTPG